MNSNTSIQNKDSNPKIFLVLILYLLGIFMGAIDTGIVSPARTIIQNSLGVNEKTGIWMITIYTLTYASVIPISGKLADKIGRKYVYLVSIFLFGSGSLICGLSSLFSNFNILLIGRVIQAIGGGGIMPIATAEFGTTFPENKRGMALGLVGATYGIANILGSSIGSTILSIFGTQNWKWLFFVNLPICLIILIGGILCIKNNKSTSTEKIDKLGTLMLICIIVSLLYGLMNIDFFNFTNSMQDISVYPYLLAFIILIPIFIFIENKAKDPILNFEYFLNPRILIVLILSLIVGIGMMGMVFVPQYAENALKINAGSGGYFVAILGLFAGVAAPLSGRLIDKFGAKKILLLGFSVSMIGSLYLVLIALKTNTVFSVCISLMFMGLGMGFTMGTPLNYMMLSNTRLEESNSALATLSLIRSIGTSISPAIMIGFIAHAGLSVQDNIMDLVGKPSTPKIVQLEELENMIDDLKSDPEMAKNLKNVSIPNMDDTSNINMDMTGGKLPKYLLDKVQSADTTNITNITKEISTTMFDEKVPSVINKIQTNVQKGIDGTQSGINGIEEGENKLNSGIKGIQTGIDNMIKARAGINQGIDGIKKGIDGVNKGIKGMEQGLVKQDKAINELTIAYNKIPTIPQENTPTNNENNSNDQEQNNTSNSNPDSNKNNSTENKNNNSGDNKPDLNEKKESLNAQIQQLKKARAELNTKLQKSKTQKKQLNKKLKTMESQKKELQSKLNDSINKKKDMEKGLGTMEQQKKSLQSVLAKTQEVKTEIPKAFDKSKLDYINSIENNRTKIENTLQSTLNSGFKQMYITVFCINLLAFVILLFYKENKTR
ncbi:Multidrug resistance protein 3 [Clostridioides difficile]|nr:MFS transporter [Clostridioides sp. ZZV14-6387]CZR96713.1 Multidrug resistance protein 3 [Clostridioides difficile]CZS05318.1 Multidrug resistance protein 3 [Clostridioides difficile]